MKQIRNRQKKVVVSRETVQKHTLRAERLARTGGEKRPKRNLPRGTSR